MHGLHRVAHCPSPEEITVKLSLTFDEQVDVWMDDRYMAGWLDGRMGGWMGGWMDGCV